jgi:signal transduction histidine kinase
MARVDPERVRQALDDLMDNALRHCGTGGTVTVSAGRNDGRVIVAVRDSGPGFPPDVLAETSPSGLGPNGNGDGRAGLGLSIVAAIAGAHGGTLRLENCDGGGAQATFDLPA